MDKITIVFGYRNRETERVKRCLDSLSDQSNKKFKVLFIDYGSNDAAASEMKELCAKYSFVEYIYSQTQGMPWNRSHALNTGIRKVKTEYTLLSDVDMIYPPNFIQYLSDKALPNTQFYKPFYFLPETFANWNYIFSAKEVNCPDSGTASKGGLQFVPTKILHQIRGFDEYYCFWGVEDRDLFHRLEVEGIETKWMPLEEVPVFHQWHPVVSNTKKDFFPDRWWDDMNIYFSINRSNSIRNNNNWGQCLSIDDRPCIKNYSNENYSECINIPSRNDSYYKAELIDKIIATLLKLKPNESLCINYQNKNLVTRNNTIKFANNIAQLLVKNFGVVYKSELKYIEHPEKFFIADKDVLYVIWKLIKNNNLVQDYYIDVNKEKTTILLS